jgi:hypothetical protein
MHFPGGAGSFGCNERFGADGDRSLYFPIQKPAKIAPSRAS